MIQTLETAARKELDEELKRNKPKDVRKLYDMLVKNVGSEDAYTFLLNLLSDCYTLMPNGRYRLDNKKYNNAVSAQLKEQKKNKTVSQPSKNSKKLSSGLDELLNAAADEEGFERTMMSDFASQISMLMMTDNEKAAAVLYKRNADLFFDEIDERIASFDQLPVSFDQFDGGPYKGYYYMNLFDDIDLVLRNTQIDDPSFLSVHEEYLKTLLDKQINWNTCQDNFQNMKESLYETLMRSGKKEEADQFIKAWKEEYPDSFMPEHALLWEYSRKEEPDSLAKGVELAERLMNEVPEFTSDHMALLEAMRMIYEEAGENEKAKQVEMVLDRLFGRIPKALNV